MEALLMQGERISVRLDEHGRPLSASTGLWLDEEGTNERIARLALAIAWMRLRERAQAGHHETRTAVSTQTRREAAQAHWTRPWLEAAHHANPRYGAQRLAQAARKLVALNCKGKPEYDRRDEITKYRAKRYLSGQ